MAIRDRIKELRRVKASDLIPNPKNWRRHPKVQTEYMQTMLEEIGFGGAVIVRETADGLEIIDGHLRTDVLGDEVIPVLVTDYTEAEADLLLATYDPLGAMAEADNEALKRLLDGIETSNGATVALLKGLADRAELMSGVDYPALPQGSRSAFRQMTFTLHEDQCAIVEQALTSAKVRGEFGDTSNANSNGNALAYICQAFGGADV